MRGFLKRSAPVAAAWAVLLALSATRNVVTVSAQATPKAPPAAPQAAESSPFLRQYCFGCHNDRAKIGGLALDTKDFEHVARDAATWEKAVRKIRTGMMPPSGARRPERSALDGFASELEARLDRAA